MRNGRKCIQLKLTEIHARKMTEWEIANQENDSKTIPGK